MTLQDTGPLVALLDRSDAHHGWATVAMRSVRRPLVIVQAVISEACYLLAKQPRARLQLRLWLEQGILQHLELNVERVGSALRLMERYANAPMSFADACLVEVARQMSGARIFTLDRDFLIYRKENSEPLELLAPFAG